MEISPLGDVVIIRRADQKSVSSGGILLPPSEDMTEDIGTVVYAGRGKTHKCAKCGGHGRIPMQVNEGDLVIFSTNGHQLTKLKGEELIILRQDSIIAVIEGDKDEIEAVRAPVQTDHFITGGFKSASR